MSGERGLSLSHPTNGVSLRTQYPHFGVRLREGDTVSVGLGMGRKAEAIPARVVRVDKVRAILEATPQEKKGLYGQLYRITTSFRGRGPTLRLNHPSHDRVWAEVKVTGGTDKKVQVGWSKDDIKEQSVARN